MKKVLALLLALCMMATLAACGVVKTNEESKPETEFKAESSVEVSSEALSEASSAVNSETPSEAGSSTKAEVSSKKTEGSSKMTEVSSKKIEISSPKTEVSSKAKEESSVTTGYGLLTDNMAYQTKPYLTGDFIQDWLCTGWNQDKWEKYLKELKEVGITTVIIQYGFHTEGNKITQINFKNNIPSQWMASGCSDKSSMLGNALAAAKKVGSTIWIGLGVTDEWWTEANQKDKTWRDAQCTMNQLAMDSIKEYYWNDYKDQIAGFYWANEMYTQNSNLELLWADMLSSDLDYLTATGMNRPMMIAPYNSAWYLKGNGDRQTQYTLYITAKDAEEIWTRFMKATRFRKGDVFCPQDGLYTIGISYADALDYLIAMKNAVEKASVKVEYWIDVESFTDSYGSAAIKRYSKQMDISAKLATKLVGFSYTHYYSTFGSGSSKLRSDYKAWYDAHK